MKYITIYGKKRNIGKKYISSIRSNNYIPCIVYCKNINIPFFTLKNNLQKILYRKEVFGFIINIEGKNNNIKAIKKEIQLNPVNNNILHVDFYKINELIPIILEIPIKFFGRPIGVTKGGEYYSPIKKLKIKALVRNIPNYIELNISHLDIGDRIYSVNLKNEKYKILNPDDTLIASVKTSRSNKITSQEEVNKNIEKEEKK